MAVEEYPVWWTRAGWLGAILFASIGAVSGALGDNFVMKAQLENNSLMSPSTAYRGPRLLLWFGFGLQQLASTGCGAQGLLFGPISTIAPFAALHLTWSSLFMRLWTSVSLLPSQICGHGLVIVGLIVTTLSSFRGDAEFRLTSSQVMRSFYHNIWAVCFGIVSFLILIYGIFTLLHQKRRHGQRRLEQHSDVGDVEHEGTSDTGGHIQPPNYWNIDVLRSWVAYGGRSKNDKNWIIASIASGITHSVGILAAKCGMLAFGSPLSHVIWRNEGCDQLWKHLTLGVLNLKIYPFLAVAIFSHIVANDLIDVRCTPRRRLDRPSFAIPVKLIVDIIWSSLGAILLLDEIPVNWWRYAFGLQLLVLGITLLGLASGIGKMPLEDICRTELPVEIPFRTALLKNKTPKSSAGGNQIGFRCEGPCNLRCVCDNPFSTDSPFCGNCWGRNDLGDDPPPSFGQRLVTIAFETALLKNLDLATALGIPHPNRSLGHSNEQRRIPNNHNFDVFVPSDNRFDYESRMIRV